MGKDDKNDTFEEIRHFTDFAERGSFTPGSYNIHHERFELLNIIILFYFQLGFDWHFGNSSGQILTDLSINRCLYNCVNRIRNQPAFV